jgi:hypothetical protein
MSYNFRPTHSQMRRQRSSCFNKVEIRLSTLILVWTLKFGCARPFCICGIVQKETPRKSKSSTDAQSLDTGHTSTIPHQSTQAYHKSNKQTSPTCHQLKALITISRTMMPVAPPVLAAIGASLLLVDRVHITHQRNGTCQLEVRYATSVFRHQYTSLVSTASWLDWYRPSKNRVLV